MQGWVPSWLLVGAIAACHTADSSSGDDAGPRGDGGSDTAGLSIDWSTQPSTIPGAVDSNITVASMSFQISNVRVIGDAGPGDDRTSIDSIVLQWQAGVMPTPILFVDAPTGLYSRIVMVADGNTVDYSYQVSGTAKVNGNTTPFEIHDRSPLAVSIDTSATLDPDKFATLDIIIHIDEALKTADFSKFENVTGTLVLDTGDDEMNDFRDKMTNNVFVANQQN